MTADPASHRAEALIQDVSNATQAGCDPYRGSRNTTKAKECRRGKGALVSYSLAASLQRTTQFSPGTDLTLDLALRACIPQCSWNEKPDSRVEKTLHVPGKQHFSHIVSGAPVTLSADLQPPPPPHLPHTHPALLQAGGKRGSAFISLLGKEGNEAPGRYAEASLGVAGTWKKS